VIQYAAMATTYSFLPILAGDLGASDVSLGLLTSVQVGMLFLGSLATALITRHLGDWALVGLGLAAMAAGVGLAAIAPWLWVLFAAQCLIGFSWGVCYPVLAGKSIKEVQDAERSSAMGVYQTGCSLGTFAGSWISGVLAGWLDIRPMFAVTAAGILALALLVGRRSRAWD
jgi:predicted MFS family arabinose efflux permease